MLSRAGVWLKGLDDAVEILGGALLVRRSRFSATTVA